jgi:alpha-amylase
MRKKLLFASTLILAFSCISPQFSQSAEPSTQPEVGLAKDLIYFVMPDRYLNGDTTNDLAGGSTQDPTGGYNPASTAFFHGGDLKGLTGNCEKGDKGLARIKDLGFTAVWLTPLVTQQPATSNGAGYHGYWGVDFLNVDPHLGTNDDLSALSACAKKLGLKLILDVVTNHTGDVIQYADKNAFIPVGKESAKNPSWLNDLSNYHNVGDMSRCWGEGPCTQLGDFYGLDDLATEKPVVYKGLTDIYGEWIKKYGFVGFRVDTARHVDNNFFKNWSPGINQKAAEVGITNFTTFGEVWDINPINLVGYIRDRGLQTVLDFPFQRTAVQFASGYSGAEVMDNLFDSDDLYLTKSSNASNLVTFLGNHDMGRVGFLISASQSRAEKDLLARTELAHALMYLSRGIPTVYYGDEVGMTGSGNGSDQLARQDMFATKIDSWKTEKRIGASPVGSGDSFSGAENPITTYLKSLAALRKQYPTLANGAMQLRFAKNNLLAFSKYDSSENREYVVAMNSSNTPVTQSIQTSSGAMWSAVFGPGTGKAVGSNLSVTLPAFSTTVFRSAGKILPTKSKVASVTSKKDFLTGYVEVLATTSTKSLESVTFETRSNSYSPWELAGVDYNWPYRVYLDPAHYSPGASVEVRARTSAEKGVTNAKSRVIKFS